MAPILLKIYLIKTEVTKALQFDESMTVYDACRTIQEKVPEATPADSKEASTYGLFLPDEDPTKGFWLQAGRPLKYYNLKSGQCLEFRTRQRPLHVKTLDGAVRTVLVDDSHAVSEITRAVAARIDLHNPQEFSFTVGEEGTLRKHVHDKKLETLQRELHTDDQLNWLDPKKTLREHDLLDETVVLTLRKKFFFSDENVNANDPVQLHLLYVQCHEAVLDSTYPVTREEAIQLAALQSQIHFGNYDDRRFKKGFLKPTMSSLLPLEYRKEEKIEQAIFDEHRKLFGMSEVNAKFRYIEHCRSLRTYGVSFFVVKEKLPGRNKLHPVLVGINRESVMRMDMKTKEVLKTWPLTTVCSYAATPNSFSLNFGAYSGSVYNVKTTDGEAIVQLLDGYIDLILQTKCALSFEVPEDIPAVEESIVEGKTPTALKMTSGGTKNAEEGGRWIQSYIDKEKERGYQLFELVDSTRHDTLVSVHPDPATLVSTPDKEGSETGSYYSIDSLSDYDDIQTMQTYENVQPGMESRQENQVERGMELGLETGDQQARIDLQTQPVPSSSVPKEPLPANMTAVPKEPLPTIVSAVPPTKPLTSDANGTPPTLKRVGSGTSSKPARPAPTPPIRKNYSPTLPKYINSQPQLSSQTSQTSQTSPQHQKGQTSTPVQKKEPSPQQSPAAKRASIKDRASALQVILEQPRNTGPPISPKPSKNRANETLDPRDMPHHTDVEIKTPGAEVSLNRIMGAITGGKKDKSHSDRISEPPAQTGPLLSVPVVRPPAFLKMSTRPLPSEPFAASQTDDGEIDHGPEDYERIDFEPIALPTSPASAPARRAHSFEANCNFMVQAGIDRIPKRVQSFESHHPTDTSTVDNYGYVETENLPLQGSPARSPTPSKRPLPLPPFQAVNTESEVLNSPPEYDYPDLRVTRFHTLACHSQRNRAPLPRVLPPRTAAHKPLVRNSSTASNYVPMTCAIDDTYINWETVHSVESATTQAQSDISSPPPVHPRQKRYSLDDISVYMNLPIPTMLPPKRKLLDETQSRETSAELFVHHPDTSVTEKPLPKPRKRVKTSAESLEIDRTIIEGREAPIPVRRCSKPNEETQSSAVSSPTVTVGSTLPAVPEKRPRAKTSNPAVLPPRNIRREPQKYPAEDYLKLS